MKKGRELSFRLVPRLILLPVNPYPKRELGQGVVALPSRTWSGNKQPNNQSEQEQQE